MCLTCDAGTPGISDPGVPLVAQAIEAGIRVTPICGPSAFTAHLSACGFDTRSFGFYGFLPREKGDLAAKLEQIGRTGLNAAVFYESPHRVIGLVEAIGAAYPQCRLSVACDISKRYEVILTGPWARVLEQLQSNPNVEKGEYSLVVELPPRLPPLGACPSVCGGTNIDGHAGGPGLGPSGSGGSGTGVSPQPVIPGQIEDPPFSGGNGRGIASSEDIPAKGPSGGACPFLFARLLYPSVFGGTDYFLWGQNFRHF